MNDATAPASLGPYTLDGHVWLESPDYHRAGGQRYAVLGNSQGTLALITHDEGDDEAAATARLLAAAPDLLAALEDAEFLLRRAAKFAGPMQDSFRRSAADARDAIALALAPV